MFLVSWGAAALSDIAGVYFTLCSGGGSGCALKGGVGVLAGMTVPVLGTAGGAALGGARFLPALAGSAAGFGVVLLQFATGAIVDPNDSFLLFIAIPSFIQAGITTLIASRLQLALTHPPYSKNTSCTSCGGGAVNRLTATSSTSDTAGPTSAGQSPAIQLSKVPCSR